MKFSHIASHFYTNYHIQKSIYHLSPTIQLFYFSTLFSLDQPQLFQIPIPLPCMEQNSFPLLFHLNTLYFFLGQLSKQLAKPAVII